MASRCTIAVGESIDTCQKSLQYFQQAVQEEQARRQASLVVWTRYDSDVAIYHAAHATWQAEYDNFQASWQSGRTLTGSLIWDGNTVTDCAAVGWSTYTDAFGWVTYTRNCNDVPNSAQAKCTSCGIQRCTCTAGLDEWCGGGKCSNYRYNANYSSYPSRGIDWNTARQQWMAAHPEPQLPTAPNETQYPDYRRIAWPTFPNIICQSCAQCMDISNLTANQIDISQLQQSCVNNLHAPAPPPPPAPAPAPAPAPTPAPTPTPAPAPWQPTQPEPEPEPVQDDSSKNMLTIVIFMILVFILIIVVALVYAFYPSDEQPQTVLMPLQQQFPTLTTV